MSTICIKFGEYRNTPVVNKTFTLVKGYQTGAKGGYVTVKNEGQFPKVSIENVKVKVSGIENIEFINGEPEMVDAIQF